MSANTTAVAGQATTTDASDQGQLWLGQFIYLDGEAFVHICRSKADAYRALAEQADLTAEDGQTVAELIEDHFGESDLTSYNVLPVDSTDLDADGDDLWLAQLLRWDGGVFVHLCRSEESAYQAVADQEDLTVGEGQTAKTVVDHELEDSGEVNYVVARVDSTNL